MIMAEMVGQVETTVVRATCTTHEMYRGTLEVLCASPEPWQEVKTNPATAVVSARMEVGRIWVALLSLRL